MNKANNITKITLKEAKKIKGKSNWSKLFGEWKREKSKVVISAVRQAKLKK